ncbi:helix-turn-helix domain-containing protein [Thermopolyspora sp. NPDC052614]|uniref:helix-turn-helix domain-containing protein n=1 Tax=Thermopolyspora sp. NPDC052614 TaxID=3155682 RepID=UPI00343E54A1
MAGLFWDTLRRDLEDPEFLREYVTESVRIAATDAIINALDEARVSAGLSKAALARAIGAEPAAVRRLFSADNVNPTLGTLAALAAALGLRISIEPLSPADQATVTAPLRSGKATGIDVERIAGMRTSGRRAVSA